MRCIQGHAMLKISIIVITYNSLKFIEPCLNSIFFQDYRQIDVTVIDNNSTDGTPDLIKEKFPQVRIIENNSNVGAAKARNQGVESASGEWIITLDCDTVLERQFISSIVATVEMLPENVGIIQPKILKSDKKTIYSTGIFLSSLRRFYDMGQGKIDNDEFSNRKNIFGACSASAVYRSKMLKEIKETTGYFDERFFFLVEDVDLSWRAQRHNYKTLYLPEAVCYHYGNSSGHNKKIRRYLCFRNRLLLILKNERLMGKVKLFPVFFIYDLPRALLLISYAAIGRSKNRITV